MFLVSIEYLIWTNFLVDSWLSHSTSISLINVTHNLCQSHQSCVHHPFERDYNPTSSDFFSIWSSVSTLLSPSILTVSTCQLVLLCCSYTLKFELLSCQKQVVWSLNHKREQIRMESSGKSQRFVRWHVHSTSNLEPHVCGDNIGSMLRNIWMANAKEANGQVGEYEENPTLVLTD